VVPAKTSYHEFQGSIQRRPVSNEKHSSACTAAQLSGQLVSEVGIDRKSPYRRRRLSVASASQRAKTSPWTKCSLSASSNCVSSSASEPNAMVM
jgi:hypothetical protein